MALPDACGNTNPEVSREAQAPDSGPVAFRAVPPNPKGKKTAFLCQKRWKPAQRQHPRAQLPLSARSAPGAGSPRISPQDWVRSAGLRHVSGQGLSPVSVPKLIPAPCLGRVAAKEKIQRASGSQISTCSEVLSWGGLL